MAKSVSFFFLLFILASDQSFAQFYGEPLQQKFRTEFDILGKTSKITLGNFKSGENWFCQRRGELKAKSDAQTVAREVKSLFFESPDPSMTFTEPENWEDDLVSTGRLGNATWTLYADLALAMISDGKDNHLYAVHFDRDGNIVMEEKRAILLEEKMAREKALAEEKLKLEMEKRFTQGQPLEELKSHGEVYSNETKGA